MQPEQTRALFDARLLQNELRWACNILKNAKIDGSRLFLDPNVFAKFVQILCGQDLPYGFRFDRSLPPVTIMRNILNFLHRFGIRTTDINPVNLISGTDNDRYKVLCRLHECFDPTTYQQDFGPLTIITSDSFSAPTRAEMVTASQLSSLRHQAITLAAELRASEYKDTRPYRSDLSGSVSTQLHEIHKLCRQISESALAASQNTLKLSSRSYSSEFLSHISSQLNSTNTTLLRIDDRLGTIADKMQPSYSPTPDKKKSFPARANVFRNAFSKFRSFCLRSKEMKPEKVVSDRTKSSASTYNTSSLVATSV